MALFAALLVVILTAAPPTRAQDTANTTDNATVLDSESEPRRRDNVFGTTDEGIRSGRDSSGDSVIRISPPEKPKEPEYPLPPILVEPKVELPRDSDK